MTKRLVVTGFLGTKVDTGKRNPKDADRVRKHLGKFGLIGAALLAK